jgi:hypothetical protein
VFVGCGWVGGCGCGCVFWGGRHEGAELAGRPTLKRDEVADVEKVRTLPLAPPPPGAGLPAQLSTPVF